MRDLSSIKDRDWEKGLGKDRRSWYKIDVNIYEQRKDDNVFVFLPPKEDDIINPRFDKIFGLLFLYHPNVTINGDSLPCLRMINQRCPVCEALSNLPYDDRKVWMPRKKGFIWVLDASNPHRIKEGVKLWVVSVVEDTFKMIRHQLVDVETGEVIDIYREPRKVFVKLSEEDFLGRKWYKPISVKLGTQLFDKSVFDKYAEQVPPFSELINFPTEEDFDELVDFESVVRSGRKEGGEEMKDDIGDVTDDGNSDVAVDDDIPF